MAAKSDDSDNSAAWMYYSKEAVSSSRNLMDDDDDAPEVEQHMSLISLPEEEGGEAQEYSSSSACHSRHYDHEDRTGVDSADPPDSYMYEAAQSPTMARVVSSDTTSKAGIVAYKRQKLCSARWMKSLIAAKKNCDGSKWPRLASSSSSSTTSSKAYGKKRHIVESAS